MASSPKIPTSGPLFRSLADTSCSTTVTIEEEQCARAKNDARIVALCVSLLSLFHLVAMNKVDILPSSALSRLPSEGATGLGATKEVFPCVLSGRKTCVKRCRLSRIRKVHDARADTDFDKYRSYLEDIIMEVKILSHSSIASHPNVVGLLAIIFLEEKDGQPDDIDTFRPALVLEHSIEEYPDLHEFLECPSRQRPISFEMASNLAAGIADGLKCLHLHGIQHGDLSDRNILIFEEHHRLIPKISDFGFSGITNSQDDVRGRPYHLWRAPELYDNDRAAATNYSDIYSFGLLCATIFLDGERIWTPEQLRAMKKDSTDPLPAYIENALADLGYVDYTRERQKKLKSIFQQTLRREQGDRTIDLGMVPGILSGKPSVSLSTLRRGPNFRSFISLSHLNKQITAVPQNLSEWEWMLSSSTITQHFKKYKTAIPQPLVENIFLSFEGIAPKNWESPSWMQIFYSIAEETPLPKWELPSGFAYQDQAILLGLHNISDIPKKRIKAKFPALYRVLENFQKYLFDMQIRAGKGLNSHYEVDYENTRHPPPDSQEIVFSVSQIHSIVLHHGQNALQHFLDSTDDPGTLVNSTVKPWNTTPLHLACRMGAYQTAHILLEYGADVNAVEDHGHFKMSPLAYAIFNQHPKTVKELLSWSCSQQRQRHCLFCAESGNTDTCRADVWFTNPAMRSGGLFVHDIRTIQAYPIFEMLIKHDSDLVNAREPRGSTPLHRATEYLELNTVRLLVEHGADVNAQNLSGLTPLHKAYSALGSYPALLPRTAENMKNSVRHSKEKVQALIDYLRSTGADEEMVDVVGRRPRDFQYPFFFFDYAARGWRFWTYYGLAAPMSWVFKLLGLILRVIRRVVDPGVLIDDLTGCGRESGRLFALGVLVLIKLCLTV